MPRALVYGGKGALGSVCVNHLKSFGYWVCSIDLGENNTADENVVVRPSESFEEQSKQVLESIREIIKDTERLDGIFCVAGGWAGGNAISKDYLKNCDLMWKQSVWSSCIASSIAANHLASDGVLVFTGAQAALTATPDMVGYGMAKAAVHHLTKSLSGAKSGIPSSACVTAILP
ncbi:unnamed protein product [Protopolystoma xenopodis]|uniref:Dihydropteridine reductase n=1 Tax=Protopolystoma xenopodis TaxID=117903 RepID=A0A448X9F7_9PLAT|nr:unnamed protein product [Protopolystoma xenopodis]